MDMPPKGLLTTQFDMYTAEAIGFEKLDVLSQRGIGHIGEAVEIIKQNTGRVLDIHNIPAIKQDLKVAQQLKSGDSIGCFYIESPAMRGILKKLQCSDYITLVAASSIIRPGVGSSGMMDEYIRRFHKPEDVHYAHPVLKEQLSETFGVMIYQEDVLKVAHHYAGLDLAEADVLRRLMSGKNRGAHHLKDIENKFFSKSKELGRPEEVTNELWRQISSFAGYSFSKAHSASYAVESYQSLYLKACYPNEFMVAVLNNEGGFYSRWLYVAEARKSGARVHLPCVNNSQLLTCIKGMDIYLGLNMIQKLESKVIDLLLTNRQEQGQYESLDDLVERTGLSLEQVVILIRSGAMKFTGKNKKTLMWLANVLFEKRNRLKNKVQHDRPLLRQASKEISIPAFPVFDEEDFFDEMEFLHFSVSLSPFHMLKTSYRGDVEARELMRYIGQTVKLVGLYVTMKPTRTKKGETMAFGTFLDAQGSFFDTVHFPNCLKQYPFEKSGLYLILGKVTESFGFPTITVEKMAKLPIRPDPRFTD